MKGRRPAGPAAVNWGTRIRNLAFRKAGISLVVPGMTCQNTSLRPAYLRVLWADLFKRPGIRSERDLRKADL